MITLRIWVSKEDVGQFQPSQQTPLSRPCLRYQAGTALDHTKERQCAERLPCLCPQLFFEKHGCQALMLNAHIRWKARCSLETEFCGSRKLQLEVNNIQTHENPWRYREWAGIRAECGRGSNSSSLHFYKWFYNLKAVINMQRLAVCMLLVCQDQRAEFWKEPEATNANVMDAVWYCVLEEGESGGEPVSWCSVSMGAS